MAESVVVWFSSQLSQGVRGFSQKLCSLGPDQREGVRKSKSLSNGFLLPLE